MISPTDLFHPPPTPHFKTGINIYEKKIVRQAGYLQELNRDARSTEYQIYM